MHSKQAIAIGIALQTQVLKTCPVHRQLYFDDGADPASAFVLAIELVRMHKPCTQEFGNDEHELTDLLGETLRTTPLRCPECEVQTANAPVRLNAAAGLIPLSQRSGFGEGALESL